MKVSILNSTGSEQRKLIRESLDYFGHKLMSPQLLNNISLRIKFCDGLVAKEKIRGDVVWNYRNGKTPKALRSFTIRIDSSLGQKKMLSTLAHEMVHVKQYAKGEMRDISHRLVRFGKKSYMDNEYCYWEQPWEIEARGRELGLLAMFLKQRKAKK